MSEKIKLLDTKIVGECSVGGFGNCVEADRGNRLPRISREKLVEFCKKWEKWKVKTKGQPVDIMRRCLKRDVLSGFTAGEKTAVITWVENAKACPVETYEDTALKVVAEMKTRKTINVVFEMLDLVRLVQLGLITAGIAQSARDGIDAPDRDLDRKTAYALTPLVEPKVPWRSLRLETKPEIQIVKEAA